MYTCIYAHVYIFIYVHVHSCINVYTYVCIFMCTSIIPPPLPPVSFSVFSSFTLFLPFALMLFFSCSLSFRVIIGLPVGRLVKLQATVCRAHAPLALVSYFSVCFLSHASPSVCYPSRLSRCFVHVHVHTYVCTIRLRHRPQTRTKLCWPS